MRPVFEKHRAAQNDRTHEGDEVSRRQERAERIKNPWHGFTREDKAGKENAGQHVSHGYLQGLHLVLGFRADKQTEAEQGKNVNQRGKHHRENAAVDRHIEEKTHDQKKDHGHGHADAKIGHQFAQHETPPTQRTHQQGLERPLLSFAHYRHGRRKSRADLQNNPDHPRDVKVRAAHRRVVEHLRPDIDRHAMPPGFAQKRLDRLGQRNGQCSVERLQRRCRV